MRLGLVITGDLKTLTGGTLYDRILVDDLRRRGHAVTIYSLPAGQGYPCQLAANLSRSLVSKVRHDAPDILLEDGLCHPALFLQNQRLRAVVNGPIVAILHQVLSSQPRPNWQNTVYGLVEKRYLHSVDACIFNSRTTREAAVAAGAPDVPGIVARPAGDRLGTVTSSASVSARAREKGPLRLLFLANVLPPKGLHRLIDALAAVSLRMWRLTVVGSLTMDSPYAQKTMTRVAARGLSPNIRFLGARDGPELAGILNESHLLALPYSHEAFGIVFLEGMAFALPAVGSTAGAAREIIRHGENGFLAEPGDPAAMKKIVAGLFAGRDRLDAMSHKALATFRRYPGWRDTMEKIHVFLKKLAVGK
ncbi:MAG: glycosyltransferase family 4 protein [Desulfobacterales bacterium]